MNPSAIMGNLQNANMLMGPGMQQAIEQQNIMDGMSGNKGMIKGSKMGGQRKAITGSTTASAASSSTALVSAAQTSDGGEDTLLDLFNRPHNFGAGGLTTKMKQLKM